MSTWRRNHKYRSYLLGSPGNSVDLPRVALSNLDDIEKGFGEVSYAQFVKRVETYRPSDLIEAIAKLPSQRFQPGVEVQEWLRMSPWGAAMVVRDALLHGDERASFRRVGDTELSTLVALHGQIFDESELVGNQDDVLLRMLTSIMSEQMPAQESVFEELARSVLLFRSGKTAEHQTVRESIENRFQMPLDEAIGSAFALFGLTDGALGRWDARILDEQRMHEFFEYVPKQSVNSFADAMTVDQSDFASIYAKAMGKAHSPKDGKSHRWGFNPLTTHPLVRVRNGNVLAPLRWFIPRRLTPSTLYYDGLAVDDTRFTDALGHVSEDYVGVQLKKIANAKVTPEFYYQFDGQLILSIDWFVELPNCLVFVESKSLRITLTERLAKPSKENGVLSTLAKAFEQINRNYEEFMRPNKDFAHLKFGLEVIGLVVTAEPIYLANTPWVRKNLPKTAVPIIVISHRELERVVMVDGRTLGDALLKVANDEEKKTWGVMQSLSSILPQEENPVLREAANELPIFNLRRGGRTGISDT